MNCWHCGYNLTWGSDHDTDDDPDYSMVTNLSCANCGSFVLVYLPREEDDTYGCNSHCRASFIKRSGDVHL